MITVVESIISDLINTAIKAMPSKPEKINFTIGKRGLKIQTAKDNFFCTLLHPLKNKIDSKDRFSFALEPDVAGSLFVKSSHVPLTISKKGNVVSFLRKNEGVTKRGQVDSVAVTEDDVLEDGKLKELPAGVFDLAAKTHRIIQIQGLFESGDPLVIIDCKKGKSRLVTADNHHIACATLKMNGELNKNEEFRFVLPKSYMRYFDSFGEIKTAAVSESGKLIFTYQYKSAIIRLSIPNVSQDISILEVFDDKTTNPRKPSEFSFDEKVQELIETEVLKSSNVEDVIFNVDRKEFSIKAVGKGVELNTSLDGFKASSILKGVSFSFHAKLLQDVLSVINSILSQFKERPKVACVVEKSSVIFSIQGKVTYNILVSRSA